MKTLITAIDKAQRAGVYTLEEISILLRELDKLGNIVAQHEKQIKEKKEAEEKNTMEKEKEMLLKEKK
jgi:hypothetical protein